MAKTNFLEAALGVRQFPIEIFVLLLLFGMAEQCRKNRKAVGSGGRWYTRKVGGSGEHVVKYNRLIGGFSGRYVTRPTGNERDADATFIWMVFLGAKGCAGLEKLGFVAAGTFGAVVTGEDDESVFLQFQFFEQA